MEPPAKKRRREEDLISGLPDDLLHSILVRLPSAAAAARTSVLSRRWRGVWAHMPELALSGRPGALSSPLLDSIDAALNSYAAPALRSLSIDVARCDVPARRVAPWLRFASQRLAGKLRLRVDLCGAPADTKELALPVCERATEVDIRLVIEEFALRPPPTGSFSALAHLKITCAQMDGGELGRVVSSPQCPRLRKLHIFVSKLGPACDVTMRSESLERLEYAASCTGKLDVTAPMLQEISVTSTADEACIIAPKLEKINWRGIYDPALHRFGVAQRHLQWLSVTHSSSDGILRSSTQLIERYDTVKELKVSLGVDQTIAGYVTFLKEMDKLPVCETLFISLWSNHHALPAMIFHLLRRCSCIRKLKLFPSRSSQLKTPPCSMSGCPCLLPNSYRLDDIVFDSLEEIEILYFKGSDEEEEFMKLLLSKCNTVTLKRVEIRVPISSEITEVVERIRGACHPNNNVQFNVLKVMPKSKPRPLALQYM